MKPHILFLTSTNLASNPRCRKEIDLALRLNYKVTYIAFDFVNWTQEKERQIQKELNGVEKIYITAGSGKLINWGISASFEFFLRKAYNYISAISLISLAISRRSLQIIWALKKLKTRPDLIIAHNSPAFYPAYYFSKKKEIPFAIDVEDYHPGEGNNKILEKLNIKLIKRVLPFSDYASFSAPLIKERIAADILPKKIERSLVINNVFSQSEFPTPKAITNSAKIQLVWFSQNIDFNRGLEKIIPAFETFEEIIEITLIGNMRNEFSKFLKPFRNFVNTLPPLSQPELHQSLESFDIGLAIEPGKDANNILAVSNKIWSYFQAGLFIIASDTVAQQNFMKQFKLHGIVVNLHSKEKLKEELMNIYRQRHKLSAEKVERFERAKAYSWEIESQQLKVKWKEILK